MFVRAASFVSCRNGAASPLKLTTATIVAVALVALVVVLTQ
jgi:hypothetical protein